MLACGRRLTGKTWLQGKLVPGKVLGGNLTFIHGTFFEVLVCVSISMQMLSYSSFLNEADWISVYMSFFYAGILGSYIVFLMYFSCTKSRLWVT